MATVLRACVVVSMMVTVQAMAVQTLNFSVSPNDLADGPTFDNGQGGEPFGYDPDSVPPTGVFEAGPAGFGVSCFWSDVQGSAAGGGTDYTAIRLSPKDIFGVSDVTIGDLSEISYYTKWLSDLDWQMKIYTEGEELGDWYGYRFNFTRPNFGDNAWNLSSTNDNLVVYDIATKTTGGSTAIPGTGTLNELAADFGDKNILFIDLISSYMTASPPGDSYLDGITITLDNNDSATIDLVANPPEVWVDDSGDDSNPGTETEPFATIQRGIAAVADGGTVNVAAGTYTENVTIDKKIILDGAGSGNDPGVNTIITAAAVNTPTIVITASGDSAVDRLELRDLRATGAIGGGNPGSGIRMTSGGSYLAFDNVASVGNQGPGINCDVVGLMDDIQLSNCDLSDNGAQGLNQNSYTQIAAITLSDCTVNNNAHGLYFEGKLVRCAISGGSYSGNGDVGIYKRDDPTKSPSTGGFTIAGITAVGNGRAMVLNYYGGSSLSISNSTITDSTGEGLTLAIRKTTDNLLLSNLALERNGNWGIFLVASSGSDPSAVLNDFSITNVTSTDSTYGIRLSASATGDPDGIAAGAITACTVTGNDFGIRSAAVPDNGVTGVTISECVIENNTTGLALAWDGVLGNVATNNYIVGNTVAVFCDDPDDTANASGNWFGTSDGAAIAALMDGPVDYTPWLGSGTDTSGDPGFQGDFSTLYVDDDSPQVGATGRVQEGIDLVSGSTVNVAPGTYVEQLDIDTDNLLLQGAGQSATIIESPETLAVMFTTSSGNRPVVYVSAENVTVKNLTVDGSVRGNANARMDGIAFYNASGEVRNVTITGVRDTGLSGNGVGLYAFNDDAVARTVTVANCIIDDYGKNAMALNGANLTGIITGNAIAGGGLTANVAQNGIQFGHLTGGTISGNVVSAHVWTGTYGGTNDPASDPEADGASGILLYHAGDTEVSDNTVSANQFGIWSVGSSDVQISGNTLTGAAGSTYVYPTGIAVASEDQWSSYYGYGEVGTTGTLSGNTVTSHAYGLLVLDSTVGGPAPSVSASGNSISGNTMGAWANTVLDAEGNWWGAPNGPEDLVGANEADSVTCFDPSTMSNVDGSGDAVSDAVIDYCPWLGVAPGMNVLQLNNPGAATVYLNPDVADPNDRQIVIDMDALNLAQHVIGCQAVLNFSSTYFLAGTGDVIVAAGGGIWDVPIYSTWDTSGDLDVAVGVELASPVGTKADGTVAMFTLTVDPNAPDGTTNMVFRADVDSEVESTFFSDLNAQRVDPGSKLASQDIVIDGTAPTMESITPAGGSCLGGTVTFVFDFADANPLADLELDIYRPGDTQATKTQVSFPAGPISPAEAATLLSAYGATIVYDVPDQTWTLTIDTTQAYWPDGQYQWYIEVEDVAGNKWGDMMDPGAHPEMKYDWSIDNTPPVISNIVATQGGDSVLCPAVAVQGVVDLYVDVVDSGCSPLVVPPTVDVAGLAVSYVDVSGDTYHYQVTVDATTANGSHAITVDAADDLGNTSQDVSSLCVDKNQITGTVSFATLTAASYTVVRDVVFKATDAGGVVETWTVPVSFVNNTGTTVATGSYVLTNVPAETTGLSAKTDWALRQKTSVTLDVSNQAVAAFSLLGGDLNGSNSVNILDYGLLKLNWFTTNAVADINGDGEVQTWDYTTMKANWFKLGDSE